MAKGNVLLLLAFMLLSIGRLAAEYVGYQHVLPLAVPLMWLSLSIGFIFTLYDMIQLDAIEVISESLQFRFGWRDLSLVKLFLFLIVTLSPTVWAAGDMWLRWDKAYQNWAVLYPWYSQLTLNVGTCLYFVFILFQGLYLGAVALCMNKEMASKYIEEEGARQKCKSLLLINAFFLVYNIIWAFTLIQRESITQILRSNVLDFGTFGLMAFHIESVVVLWIFLLANHSKPEATDEMPIQIPDSPTEGFLYLFRLLYGGFFTLYILLRIFLYFEVLETTYLLALFLVFLVAGIICIGFKIWLLWKFIVIVNVPVLTKNYEMKHWSWAILLTLSMMSSLAVIIYLGKDRYDLWQPLQEAMLFQFFLSLYVVAHMLLVLFEGLVAIGLLFFEDILPYHSEDFAPKRRIAEHVFMKCYEASKVFSMYSMVFAFGLPHSGLKMATLLKLLGGPTLFHWLIAMTYSKFEMGCLKQPEQQQPPDVQGVQEVKRNLSMHSSQQKEPWHGAKSLVDHFPSRFLVLFYTCLFSLSFVRWLLVQETMGSQIPPQLQTFITYAIWLAYQGVCYHWLYVMIVYLSCRIVIKRSFGQIWWTVQESSVLNYPKSILFGISFPVLIALAVASEVLRCNLSTSKWAYHDWSVIVGYPLMAIHASALICQGLLLIGAWIASDTTRDTKKGGNVPCFHDSFGYLLVINIFLLVEHALFIFYTNIDIWEPLAFGLIVYHAGSCIIVVLLHTQQEHGSQENSGTSTPAECHRD